MVEQARDVDSGAAVGTVGRSYFKCGFAQGKGKGESEVGESRVWTSKHGSGGIGGGGLCFDRGTPIGVYW